MPEFRAPYNPNNLPSECGTVPYRGRQTIVPLVLAEHNFRQEVPNMRVKITLACTECKQRNYNTKKNKKNDPDRLEMNKYCKFCKKHTLHKETK